MQEKSPIKQRILQYIDTKGLSKYEFYKKSGITRGILDQNTGISEDNVARFIAYDKSVNIEWLLLGEGPMFRREKREDPVLEETKYTYSRPLTKADKEKTNNDLLLEYVEENEELWTKVRTLERLTDAQEETIQTQKKLIERLEKLLDPKSGSTTATDASRPVRSSPRQLDPKG